MQVYVEMGIAALKAREDLWEEVGTHHWRDADLDCALLQLLVVVDLEYGILYVAQCHLDASEEDCALGGQRQLFLTAVKKLDAKFSFEFLDCDGDVRLRDAEAFGGTRDVLQAARHLEIFQLP